jgi:hypothetical protein
VSVAVLDHQSDLVDIEVEAIRDCLRQITDAERPRLWSALEALRATLAGGAGGIAGILHRAPAGPIRRCLTQVARETARATEYGERSRRPAVLVRGRARPAFLGLLQGLTGTVAPVETWAASRTGLYWEKVEADAFAGVQLGTRGHLPVPLDYRHHPDVVLGCSRRFELAGDGSLLGTFELGSHPAAQHVGRAAQRGDLGLSMSVRFRTRWLAHPAPDEWDPVAGVLDVCVRDDAVVEAVALTPAPTYPAATVERVW